MPSACIRKAKSYRYLPAQKQKLSARAGQSIIESCLVIGLICVVSMIMLQVAEITSAREILYYATACSARCRTVGFNQFMVQKTGRVACIPNAGKMTVPDYRNEDAFLRTLIATRKSGSLFIDIAGPLPPPSGQYAIEQANIPEYLYADNMARAEFYLNYADWDSIVFDPGTGALGDGTAFETLHVTARQEYRLWVPLHRTFYAADTISLHGSADIENHYSLYLDDKYW